MLIFFGRNSAIIAITIAQAMLFAQAAMGDRGVESPVEAAYYKIESNVFDRDKLNEAWSVIEKAGATRSKDPWVFIDISLMILVTGYTHGDWYDVTRFQDGTIEKALKWSEYAQRLDPNNSQAMAQTARILIIKRDYDRASELLDRASDVDSGSFYPWYYKGILAEKKKEIKKAEKYFREAERRAFLKHHAILVDTHRINLSRIVNDIRQEELLLKKNIARDPERAQAYGNYANFLKIHERYDEAIEYFERAISISPYPLAVRLLKETRQLKQSSE